jgi:hypothetical protein
MPFSPGAMRYRSDLARRGSLSARQAVAAVSQTAPLNAPDPARWTESDLGFWWWQVLGSNQRRLSRRFYRALAGKIASDT